MAEGTKQSGKAGAAGLRKQPMDFVSPKKASKTAASSGSSANSAKVAPVLSAKDAINARAKATKPEMPAMGSAKDLINSAGAQASGRGGKSAANLHHSSLQKNLESTRTSASALLKMAKAPKTPAPPDLTNHADPLAKTAPIVAARLGTTAEKSSAAKSVVRTSLRLGSSAKKAEKTAAVLPSNSRMVRMAKPVMSTDEELIQAFETSLQKPASGDLLENAIQSARGTPVIESSSSRSLAKMVQAAHVGELGRSAASIEAGGRKTSRKNSPKLSIGAKSSAGNNDDVYDAASLDFIETSEIIASLKAEASGRKNAVPILGSGAKTTKSASSAKPKGAILPRPSSRRPRMSDISPAAQMGMKAAVRGAEAKGKVAKKTLEAETVPVKLGVKAAISQAVGMPSATVKVPEPDDNALKVKFISSKKTDANKKTQPLRFSEQAQKSNTTTSANNGRRSLRDIFKGTVTRKTQKGNAVNTGVAKKSRPAAADDTKAVSLGVVESYGSEMVDRRAGGASTGATYEPDRSHFASFEEFGREVGDVGLGAKGKKREQNAKAGNRNDFADATASYQDLKQTKQYDPDHVAESVAELGVSGAGADARSREQARANSEAERVGQLVSAMDSLSELYDDERAPGRSDLTTTVQVKNRSGVAPAVRPSIDYYSANYFDAPEKTDSAGGARAKSENSSFGREPRQSVGMNVSAGLGGSAASAAGLGAVSGLEDPSAGSGSVLASLKNAGGIEKDLEAAFAQSSAEPKLLAKPDNRYALGPDSPFLLKSANVEKRPLSDNASTPTPRPRTINRGVTAKAEPAHSKKTPKKLAKVQQKTHKPSPRDGGARPTVIVPSAHRSKTPLFCLVIFTIILGVIAGATLYLCFFQ